jgi:two-component sensor histidine kinase
VSRVTKDSGEEAGFLAVSRDITETEVGRQAMIIAAQELRHRLKNTYAMIGSLIYGFARGNPEREAFAQDMQQRLISLSAAQALFSTQEVPCDIQTLVPALTEPFETPGCPIEIGALSNATVDQGQADAIALVLGELAVNSAKHGALGATGLIEVSTMADPATLILEWNETSAKPVHAHDRDGGQGLKLIDRIVRARKGSLGIEWHDHGLKVTLAFQRS